MATKQDAQRVLSYWFGEAPLTPAWFRERTRLWFMGGRKVDDEIRAQFGPLLESAGLGELDSWLSTPREALALVVLLDQFALNAYRDAAKGYELSEVSLAPAKEILARGWYAGLSPAEKVFVLMPLEHSEALADQEECVARMQALAGEVPPELREMFTGFVEFAERHRRVVARFGRFPHRNAALGRESTAEEKAFLASKEAPF